MKNTILILSGLMLFLSCNKKEPLDDIYKNISSFKANIDVVNVNGRLVFNDSTAFDNILCKHFNKDFIDSTYLSLWEDSLNFISLRTKLLQYNDTTTLEMFDPLFATVLNDDSIVQIGNRIYMISIHKQKIYIIPDGDENKVQYFDEMRHIDSVIKEFDLNNDAAWYVQYDNIEQLRLFGKRPCDGPIASKQQDDFKPRYEYTVNNKRYRFKGYTRYFNGAIYFSLHSQIMHEKKALIGWLKFQTYLVIDGNGVWRNTCDAGGYNDTYKDKLGGELNYRPYSSTRALSSYDLYVKGGFVRVDAVPAPPTYNYPITWHSHVTHIKWPV